MFEFYFGQKKSNTSQLYQDKTSSSFSLHIAYVAPYISNTSLKVRCGLRTNQMEVGRSVLDLDFIRV